MKQSVKLLNKLIRLNKNSEEGFRVAAESVQNRGLKALLKAYAQQRYHFRQELEELVHGLDGRPYNRSSKIGSLHRGWIIIKASLTIGADNVEKGVLAECRRGEQYALKSYESFLKEALSTEIHEVIVRQYDSLCATAHDVIDMSGDENGRLVVRLFNNDADAKEALHGLHFAGFDDDHIRTLGLNQQTTIYKESDEKRKILSETAVAGGFGGAVGGTIIGLISTVALVLLPNISLAPPIQLIAFTSIICLLIGCAMGLFFGFLIGMSTLEQDVYLYKKSLEQGQVLMMVDSERGQAQMATDIMRQVNIAQIYNPA